MHSTQNKDDDAKMLAGVPASSLPKRPPLGSVILSFQARNAAASMALEEASSPDWEVPPTIGELAVRLVAEWKLPRIVCRSAAREEDAPTGAEEITGG